MIEVSDSQAQRIDSYNIERQDPWLMPVVAVLVSLGMVMVYSATVAGERDAMALNVDGMIKHLIHVVLGVICLWVLMRMPMSWVQSMSRPLLLLGVVMMFALLMPGMGVEVNGSLRWFDFGGVRFQPSELIKMIALIYVADYLARKYDDLHLFKVGIVYLGLVVGLIGVLLIFQPDFGTLVVIFVTVASMMFLAGVRFLHFLLSVSAASAIMAALIWFEPYRLARLMSYRDPWADPFGSGFQLVQALIAIGRGEWFGVGLGNSIQKLFYLPHAGNDFLIAIIGEELGAVGVLAVLALFAMLCARAFVIANRAFGLGQRFSGFLAQGIGLLFAFQAGVHVGVNIGLLPTKGLTLPLMSAGGSSMVSSLMAIGLLLAIDRQSHFQGRAALQEAQ